MLKSDDGIHFSLVRKPNEERIGKDECYFKEQFNDMMAEFFNDRFDFYKKMDDNPSMKNMILQKMYEEYNSERDNKI